jgi:MoxR-like ATPase
VKNADTEVRDRALQLARRVKVLREELAEHLIGQDALVEELVVALMAGGHVLLEGLPGLGKTLLVRSLAQCLGMEFSRIQFTPDLMPADVTGTRFVDDRGPERRFRFQPGPLFANLVLADEINRATPKTQSALLEAMQEGSVTVASDTHMLPTPFHVVATQNPIELEGTYPLPEAQLDRFMVKLLVTSPPVPEMVRILDTTTGRDSKPARTILSGEEVLEVQALARQVICGEHLLRYVAEILESSHPASPVSGTAALLRPTSSRSERPGEDRTQRLVRYGASARAGQAVILGAKVRALLDGRPSVSMADVDLGLLPSLRHRVVLSFEAEAEGVGVADLLQDWVSSALSKIS